MIMSNQLLSVCCLSYNHEQYIEKCIKSIWNQNYDNIEILALDDGSSDGSINILNSLKEISPVPMKVFSQKNTGNIGANFNFLFKQAMGDYIAIIACDDAFIPNTLGPKASCLKEDSNLAFVCDSKVTVIDKNDKIITNYPTLKLETMNNPSIKDILELDYSELGSFYMQGAIFRKSIIDKISGFDEDMICDDIVFRTKYARYILNYPKYCCKVFNEPSVYYRRHNSNISSNSVRQIKGVIEYLNKYWPDKKPPETLFKWILALEDKDLINELFFASNYIPKILKHINVNDLLDENGICYYKIGIPGIIMYSKHRKPNEKIKIIKLFGIEIFKSVKKHK